MSVNAYALNDEKERPLKTDSTETVLSQNQVEGKDNAVFTQNSGQKLNVINDQVQRLVLSMPVKEGMENRAELFDMNGELVDQTPLDKNGRLVLFTDKLEAGYYLMVVHQGDNIAYRKMFKIE